MSKPTKADRATARAHLLTQLLPCTRRKGCKSTLLLIVSNWRSTSTGLACDIEARRIDIERGRPNATAYLNNLIHDALGIHQTKSGALYYSGYGYCRTDDLAKRLAQLVNLPIRVQQIGESVGPNGWVSP